MSFGQSFELAYSATSLSNFVAQSSNAEALLEPRQDYRVVLKRKGFKQVRMGGAKRRPSLPV
ncbi:MULTISPECIES: hypothetical protein [Pseudanabaena]|uniref:Uncharacterized protein n=1 Tax=Pseudanabaena catenata USMAC16 TaxID=1855837 RepID=A0A9X4M7K7_9CYAN|nr:MULTISPECIES: hypothetical protein [Pseudanabaena]MDG3494283.1 hypothetical protein [Pseudanabaena catenata USMAC16]